MTVAQATRIRGGIDLALVLSMLSRASRRCDGDHPPPMCGDPGCWRDPTCGGTRAPEDDDDQGEDSAAIRAAADELGKLTVGEAAERVLALMEAEGRRMLAQDPRQLALFDDKR